MRKATLTRGRSTDDGTPGDIVTDSGFRCVSIELPYRDIDGDGLSDKGRSCLPAMTAIFDWGVSPKHGPCYIMRVDDEAPNRDHIEIHSANLAGDVSKGRVSQLEGCIAPGVTFGKFRKGHPPAGDRDQLGVTASTTALKALENDLGHQSFELTIAWSKEAA